MFNVWEVKTVKSTNRRPALAAGLIALVLAAPLASLTAQQGQPQPQRGGQPNQDTPYILITTFLSSDRKLGLEAGDEVRKRVANEHSAKELFVVPKRSIDATLEASGYRPDSALNASDLMELSKQLHGEYVIDGAVKRNGTNVVMTTRLLTRTGTQTLAQPLPSAEGKDVGDAAKTVERNISDALKAFPAYKKCISDLRAAKNSEAIADARAGLALYPASTVNQICILTAFINMKAAPDSIIRVALLIKEADPTSTLARSNLAEAYKAKGDKDKAIEEQLALYRIDPTNTTLIREIINSLANSGAPDKALPIIDSLLVNNPGDPEMLGTKWKLQLAAAEKGNRAMYAAALASGEAYIKADTAAANADYFQRQIGAAQRDSNNTAIAELAARAAAKFPTNADFNLLNAQNQMKAGQLQQALASAKRVADANPKESRAWLLMLAINNQLGQSDSAIATAQKAIAAGVSKDEIGTFLAGVIQPVFKKAQDSKARDDWEAVLKTAQTADQIAPSQQSAFFIGVAAFSIAQDAITNAQNAQKPGAKKEERAKGCEELKVADDMFALAQVQMPKGGRVAPEAAANIMTGINTYSPYIAQFRKALACK